MFNGTATPEIYPLSLHDALPIVPAGTRTSSTSAATAKASKKPAKHKVKRGDTLSAIASKYGVSMNDIKTANHMKSGEVQLGQTLTIPQS